MSVVNKNIYSLHVYNQVNINFINLDKNKMCFMCYSHNITHIIKQIIYYIAVNHVCIWTDVSLCIGLST